MPKILPTTFLPDIGTLQTYRPPQGPGIRVDDGFEEGMDIPIYYDPMIAKLTVHGSNREEAIKRMLRAMKRFRDNRNRNDAGVLPVCPET